MKNKINRRPGDGGFSLVEVLIAVAIVVVMGGVVAWNVLPSLFQSMRDRAAIDIENLSSAVDLYHMTEHKLPTESEWPRFLLEGSKRHPEPYIKKGAIKDPWDGDYVYRRLTGSKFEIISYGKDGLPGGEGDDADISNVEKRN